MLHVKHPLRSQALGILLPIMLSFYWRTYSGLETYHETEFLVSMFASTLAALGLSLLIVWELQRSNEVSALATLYPVACILCDILHLNVLSKTVQLANVLELLLLRCFVHSALLVLRFSIKRPVISASSKPKSPEELYGSLSRALFIWINPILLRGYTNILVNQDLPPLSKDIKPELTRKAMLETWSIRG